MSYRFIIGVAVSALVTNIWVAAEIMRNHTVMTDQPVWQYLFINIPWFVWAGAFGAAGVLKLIFLVSSRDRATRRACLLSFILLSLMFVLSALAYFEGVGPRFTLFGPILILSALTSEGLYLVLSSYDVLDRVRFRRRDRESVLSTLVE